MRPTSQLEPKTITLDKTEYSWIQEEKRKAWNSEYSKAQRALRLWRIGQFATKFATKINPYTRAFSYAWDAYDWWTHDKDKWMQSSPGGYDLVSEGFTLCCQSGSPPYQKFRRVGGPSNTLGNPPKPICTLQSNCGTTLQTVTGAWGQPLPLNIPNPTSKGYYLVTYYFGIEQQSGTRMRFDEKWQKIFLLPNSQTEIQYKPLRYAPQPATFAPPEPMISIGGRLPLEQPYAPPYAPPYTQPVSEISFGGGGGRGMRVKTVPHENLRPWRNKPEKKMVVWKTGPGPAVAKGLNALTEALDVLESVWKALPERYRTRNATPQDMAKDVYKHWKKIVIADAIDNIARDQLQDYALGRMNKAANQITKHDYWRSPTGPTGAIRRVNHRYQQ